MRAAEFTLGARNPGDEDASPVVYCFGPGTAGSVEANIDRWCSRYEGMLDGMRPAPTRRLDDDQDLGHP